MKTLGRLLVSLGVVWLAACSGSNSTLLPNTEDGGVAASSSATTVATHSSGITTSAGVPTTVVSSTTAVGTTASTSSAMTTSGTAMTMTSVMTTSTTSATSSTSTRPTVVCGNMSCSAPTGICCVPTVGMRSCVATAGACNGGVTRACDGVDNCANRQVCCPTTNGGTACDNNCGAGVAQVCQSDTDCTGSMVNTVQTPLCQTTAGNGLQNRCVECLVATADAGMQGCTGNQRCVAGRCN